jgi:hypothetical protein
VGSKSRRSIARTARTLAGQLIRRLGALPEGQPDGLGEDAALRDAAFAETVLFVYPDAPSNLYQVRMWLPALEELNATLPVAVLVQDSRVAAAIRAQTVLMVYPVAGYGTFERMADEGEARLALYPAHHSRNFQLMRRADLAHVYLGHGESDKAVSSSNQLKAYDFTFVAGQAAIDRASVLPFYDAAARALVVGRPQLGAMQRGPRPAAGRTTVLYAPTWEGGQASMSYGSLAHFGPELVAGLIADGFRVVFRPHPRTGISDPGQAAAARAVTNLIHQARVRDPDVGHRISVGGNIIDDFNSADLLVADVSSVVIDWLPTMRPLLVTDVGDGEEADSRALRSAPRLRAGQDAMAAVRRVIVDGVDPAERADLVSYYLGDVANPAAAFAKACAEVIDRHTKELAIKGIRREP